MEKFRKFGDAATGINPFTVVIAPTTIGRVGATLMYPMRLLFCTLFFLLLVVLDVLSLLLYSLYLGILGKLLIGPLQRLMLRALLFFHGHLIPVREANEATSAVMRGGKGAAESLSAAASVRTVQAGDVVVCNMQSVWDAAVLEVSLATPYYAVAFPLRVSEAEGAEAEETGLVRLSAAAQKRCRDRTTDDPVAYEEGAVAVKVFWPGLFQRWRVWAYVRRTGRLSYLRTQVSLAQSSAATVNVIEAQRQARGKGVPLLCFPEGTCTNGKGLLTMPAMRVSAARGTEGTDKECVLWTAVTAYQTPALQSVVSEGESVLAVFFRAGLLLYGSTNPNWTSPFFPRADVRVRAVTVPTASGARCLRRWPDGQSTSAQEVAKAGACPWELSASGVDCLRAGMAQRPKSAVVSASAAAGAGGSGTRRPPLSVGMTEKLGFVETFVAM